jgi:DNA-binding NtrC family response regulator
MITSERERARDQKSPRTQTNVKLAQLAAADTTSEALHLTLEIVETLGASPEKIRLLRDGREEVVRNRTRQVDPRRVDVEKGLPGGTIITVTCTGAVGSDLRKEIEAVLQVAALRAELCARKLWQPQVGQLPADAVDGIIGRGAATREHIREIEILARSTHPVMITGERGTGKTTSAAAIHRQSARRDRPFLDLDCTGLTESLIETQLFGHEKGAFTGAAERKIGFFEQANGGTIFLDEIAEMPPTLQVKLLKAVEQQKIRRVGGTQDIKVDVRVIAATSQDLRRMIAEGRFRAELYDRLSVLELRTYPLREKREDIPALIDFQLKDERRRNGRSSAYSIEEEAVRLLVTYDWPGNIRELQNVIARLTARVAGEAAITVEDVRRVLPSLQHATVSKIAAPSARAAEGEQLLPDSVRRRLRAETLREYLARVTVCVIEETLREHGDNKSSAGEELGLHRNSLRDRLVDARQVVEDCALRLKLADAA